MSTNASNSRDSENKRQRLPSTTQWEKLPFDMLQSIFNRLSFIDVLRAKAVCSNWYSVAKSLRSHSRYRGLPWLLIPPQHQERYCNDAFGFLNHEKELHHIKFNAVARVLGNSCCIGSSHGYLIFMDISINLFLLNPITGFRFEFPSLKEVLGIKRIWRDRELLTYTFMVEYDGVKPNSSELQDYKAILTSYPSWSKNDYQLVLICGKNYDIFFCQNGSWNSLDGKHAPYFNIVCSDNVLYALNRNRHVEAWDMSSSIPVKKIDTELIQQLSFLDHRHSTKHHLVKSFGKILLVVRCTEDKELPLDDEEPCSDDEEPLSDEEDMQRDVALNRTTYFYVLELDVEANRWFGLGSLRDNSLFLGQNKSFSIPATQGCRKNCIYFTEDCWIRSGEDYCHEGHEMGVYDMVDGTVEKLFKFDVESFETQPVWIIPSPW